MSDEEAAALPLVSLTAWQALEASHLSPGQRVLVRGRLAAGCLVGPVGMRGTPLRPACGRGRACRPSPPPTVTCLLLAWPGLLQVHAASGGVGSVAVQLAKARGLYVLGTCSAANAQFVREVGTRALGVAGIQRSRAAVTRMPARAPRVQCLRLTRPAHALAAAPQLGCDRVIDYRSERFEDACGEAPLDCVIDGARCACCACCARCACTCRPACRLHRLAAFAPQGMPCLPPACSRCRGGRRV